MQDVPADPIAVLVHHLSRLPGIGGKTATRLAYFLVRDAGLAGDLSDALREAATTVGRCGVCGDFTALEICATCADPKRESAIVCVVERSQDLQAIERAAVFRGRYHILGGALSPLDGVGPDVLRVRELLDRLMEVEEVILATNPTVEGDATAMYLARLLKPIGVKVSRIARGVSVGSELEYTDAGTIGRALEERREL
jgi:recombination protein RecR